MNTKKDGIMEYWNDVDMDDAGEEYPPLVHLKSCGSVVDKYLPNIPPFQHSNIPVKRRDSRR